MIKLLVGGACGRMGGRIIHLALKDPDFRLTGVFETSKHPGVGTSLSKFLGGAHADLSVEGGLEKVIEKGDVLIDFTSPEATPENLCRCIEHKKAIVIGTTGLPEETLQLVEQAAKKIPIVQSPNMSLGVNLLFRLTELVAMKLGDDYDIEIVEAHHRNKKDSPSGTALELARRAARERDLDPGKAFVYGREGLTGVRDNRTIGIHAVRGGDVIGEHTVSFLSEGERIELVHKASSRDAFAKGALLAAKFLADKKKGLFTMQQVLGL
ncbi:MAG TPA: 4-hydroxy-tetrahydrodipicolinate reductase [Candidatus Omnitrophota bacterium]|nr:4-hydroxy-tetrahydrodipicolinate reductase [Candidatus Omnitrophota bacterium]